MLTRFKLKDEQTIEAIFHLLQTLLSNQLAINNLLIVEFTDRNCLDLVKEVEHYNKEVAFFKDKIRDNLYSEFGDLDLTEISIQ